MANTTVTLYIDDTSLRLTVSQGKVVKEWAELPLEPGLIENNLIVNEAEVAARIKKLFTAQKTKIRKIFLGISGLRCLTRPIVFPRLPKEMLGEAVRREAQRVLPVPLEELYLSWQAIPSSAEQTQVFIVGIPRKTVDALIKTLQRAGLKPNFMEIKPLLLARAVKDLTAIVIDVQAQEFDIVTIVDGVPRGVRSTRFASGAISKEEKLTAITNELNRNISFYNTNNPEKTLSADVTVFTSGDFSNETDLYQPLSAEIGHPVSPLASPLEYPEGFDNSHYMANIGLASTATISGGKPESSVITLNALPSVYQTKDVSLTNIIAIPGALAAIGVVAFLVMFIQSVSMDITSLNTELNKTTQLAQQKQSQRQELSTKVADLQKKIDGVKAARDGLTAVLGIIEKQAEATDKDMAAAMESLPENINMSSLHHISNVITITGVSTDERHLSSYIARLDSSGRFGKIVVTDMTRNKSGMMDFTLVGTVQAQTISAGVTQVALGSLPFGVNLTNVNSDGNTLTLDGIAPNSDKVFSYLRALVASNKFSEITVTRMTNTEAGGMIFSLILKTGE